MVGMVRSASSCWMDKYKTVTRDACSKHVGGVETAAYEALLEMESLDLKAEHERKERCP